MMSRASNHRLAGGFRMASFCAVMLLASVASAGPIVSAVRYDGLDGYGLTQQTASASGIPIVPMNTLAQATGLTVTQDFDESSVSTGPPATGISNWNVTNDVGKDLLGQLYLVFAKPLENTILVNGQSQLVDYAPDDVGLTLQNGAGGLDWVIFQVFNGLDLYYYPAVSLGSLGAGETTASPFQVNYILDNPQIFLDATGFELGIPKWQLLAAFVPIPEPSPALLVAAGLGILAAGRRRRS
jgi:MYXO-CTERM domain-containing protein